MNDRKLYEQILGIRKPWHVERVDLRLDEGEVLIHVEGLAEVEQCPECDRRCARYDSSERRWRHLDTCQFRTILVAQVPRVKCNEHGVHQIRVPWAEERSRFTALFEALVIDWLLLTENIAAVAKGLRLSWDEVARIRSSAVSRGLKRRGKAKLPAALGVDETSVKKRHEYVTIVNALDQPRVLDVIDHRTTESLDAFWSQYSAKELSVIEKVAMDMWPPYITSTSNHLEDPEDKIVFDKFHVMKHLGDAVDKVRRTEHRLLLVEGDERLKGTRYLWLTHPQRLEGDARRRVNQLRNSALRTARAFRYKEQASRMWGYVRYGMAERVWRSWLHGALRCSLEPIRAVARMIRHHWAGVMNAATSDITNAASESMNAQIQRIKKRACGYRSRSRFREAILFHFGALQLYPEMVASIHTKP
ncbi:MAG TPA: ISL3 family transposase [Thermoanaerobaculia bacterium]|nr:ISL3 family transposase [Thermoanaerobaculia bacterium]